MTEILNATALFVGYLLFAGIGIYTLVVGIGSIPKALKNWRCVISINLIMEDLIYLAKDEESPWEVIENIVKDAKDRREDELQAL